jgi:fatty acid amide hydrolase
LGIEARRHAVDDTDASLVARLREAGAVVIGKANVPQAMYLHETDNPVWGRTNHPGDADRSPGGSSGGDAAAVAAGVVPLAVGTDLAGSIRQPAHACGIAGLLPRSATLGDGGSFDTIPHLTVVRPRAGFLAQSVADLARAAEAVGIVAASAESPRRPLRIAWWDEAGPLEPSPAVCRAVHEAVGRLGAAGATVERVSGEIAEEAAWLLLAILSADGGADVRQLFSGGRPMPDVARLLRLGRLPRPVRPVLAALARLGGRRIEARGLVATGPRRGAAWESLLAARDALAARVKSLASRHDAVVCPVSALPALRHGTAARLVVAAAPCMLANLLDLPAGAVPVTTVRPEEETGRGPSADPVERLAVATDRGSAGLPVGVQVIGLDTTPGAGERRVLDVMTAVGR